MTTRPVVDAGGIRFSPYLLVLPAFAVAFLFPSVLDLIFNSTDIGQGPSWKPQDVSGYGAAAGIGVGATFSLLMVTCLAAITTGFITLFRWAGWDLGIRYFLASLVIYVAALVVTFDASPPMIDKLGKDTFCATVGRHLLGYSAEKTKELCDKTAWERSAATAGEANFMLRRLWIAITTSGIAAVLVIVTITMAVVSLSGLAPIPSVTLVPLDPAKPGDGEKLDPTSKAALDAAVRDLARRMRSFKLLAFTSAVGLASGAAFLKTWAEWPLAFWHAVDAKTDPAGAALVASYQTVAASFVGYQSLFFALIMVASFGPLGVVFSERGRDLARLDPMMSGSPAQRTEWLTAHGLSLTTSEQIQRLLLFVAPLLAAPVAELVKQLVGVLKP